MLKKCLKWILPLVLVEYSLLLSFYSYAGSTSGVASVVIAPSFLLTETSIVDFKQVPAVNGSCSMDKKGRLTGICSATDGQIGTIEVQGTERQWVTVSVTQMSSVDGVTYQPLLASNSTTSDAVRLDKAGRAVIDIIGDLVLQNPTGGLKNLNYTITVNYQ